MLTTKANNFIGKQAEVLNASSPFFRKTGTVDQVVLDGFDAEIWVIFSDAGKHSFKENELFIPSDAPVVDMLQLIETVYEQGCVRLKNGKEGIPRKLEITPEGALVTVDCARDKHEVTIEEIAEIVFVG